MTTDPAAQDESSSGSMSNDEEASTSKDAVQREEREEDSKDWLQLSIGKQTTVNDDDPYTHDRIDLTPQGVSRQVSVELDLLRSGHSQMALSKPSNLIFDVPNLRAFSRPTTNFPSANTNHSSSFNSSQPPKSSLMLLNHGFSWSDSLFSSSSTSPSPSSSSLTLPWYVPSPFQLQIEAAQGASSEASSDFRVINAPKRAHLGIWFLLRASQNQEKEPFLPQIPKSYLRVKDGRRTTVRLILKYLANKLRLDSESEIEIACRGQKLTPFVTLQQVRDEIWSPRSDDVVTLLPNSAAIDHVMLLHYARTA